MLNFNPRAVIKIALSRNTQKRSGSKQIARECTHSSGNTVPAHQRRRRSHGQRSVRRQATAVDQITHKKRQRSPDVVGVQPGEHVGLHDVFVAERLRLVAHLCPTTRARVCVSWSTSTASRFETRTCDGFSRRHGQAAAEYRARGVEPVRGGGQVWGQIQALSFPPACHVKISPALVIPGRCFSPQEVARTSFVFVD